MSLVSEWLEKVRTETGDGTSRGFENWNLIQEMDNSCLREWSGLEYLFWRPAIPEMPKYLDVHDFRFRRNRKESMSACALREEKVYLQMTRSLARLRLRWNNWSGSWRSQRETFEDVDGDDGQAWRDTDSWLEKMKC